MRAQRGAGIVQRIGNARIRLFEGAGDFRGLVLQGAGRVFGAQAQQAGRLVGAQRQPLIRRLEVHRNFGGACEQGVRSTLGLGAKLQIGIAERFARGIRKGRGQFQYLVTQFAGRIDGALLQHDADVLDAARQRALHGAAAFFDDAFMPAESFVDPGDISVQRGRDLGTPLGECVDVFADLQVDQRASFVELLNVFSKGARITARPSESFSTWLATIPSISVRVSASFYRRPRGRAAECCGPRPAFPPGRQPGRRWTIGSRRASAGPLPALPPRRCGLGQRMSMAGHDIFDAAVQFASAFREFLQIGFERPPQYVATFRQPVDVRRHHRVDAAARFLQLLQIGIQGIGQQLASFVQLFAMRRGDKSDE